MIDTFRFFSPPYRRYWGDVIENEKGKHIPIGYKEEKKGGDIKTAKTLSIISECEYNYRM